MEYFRTLAQAEEEEAFSNGVPPGCFHSNVLYKRVDRKRFETDAAFRSQYRKANLKPVWELFGPLPVDGLAKDEGVQQQQQRPQVSFSFGDEKLFRANEADKMRGGEGGIVAGKQKGRVPVRKDGKVKGKEKEKRKGVGRVQQGIRGLLSKMNFFS